MKIKNWGENETAPSLIWEINNPAPFQQPETSPPFVFFSRNRPTHSGEKHNSIFTNVFKNNFSLVFFFILKLFFENFVKIKFCFSPK